MIIIKLNGGLGNQMFQYAAGRQLAEKNHTFLKLDLSNYIGVDPLYRKYDLSVFKINADFATKDEIEKIKKKGLGKYIEKFTPYFKRSPVKYRGYNFDPNILKLGDNIILDGYWQSEKYFKDVANIIEEEFTLKNGLGATAEGISEKIINTNSVSLHIRRGDYLSGKFSGIYPVLPMDYYHKAIDLIANKNDNPVFFIFSDDIEWVKNNFKISFPAEFVSDDNNLKEYEELILMSRCHHNIIANSSFSWWSAWLNINPKKIIIAPRNWLKVDNYEINDLIPETWLKL